MLLTGSKLDDFILEYLRYLSTLWRKATYTKPQNETLTISTYLTKPSMTKQFIQPIKK